MSCSGRMADSRLMKVEVSSNMDNPLFRLRRCAPRDRVITSTGRTKSARKRHRPQTVSLLLTSQARVCRRLSSIWASRDLPDVPPGRNMSDHSELLSEAGMEGEREVRGYNRQQVDNYIAWRAGQVRDLYIRLTQSISEIEHLR